MSSSSKSNFRSGPGRRLDEKQGVHFLQIVPSRASQPHVEKVSTTTSLGVSADGAAGIGGGDDGAGAGAGNVSGGRGDGKGNGKGRVGILRYESAKNSGNLADYPTPLSQTPQNRLDLSVVFGPFSAKYENDINFDGADGDPHRSHIQTKEEKKRAKGPEHEIKLFAFRLALIEKAASGLGTIAFLWATVVILGGFASTVGVTDFWVVTVIILAETSRIFSRSHELEWKHMSSNPSAILGLGWILSRIPSVSFSIMGTNSDSTKHGRSSSQTPRHVKKAKSARGRTFEHGSARSPQSSESDQTTPHSFSGSWRHHCEQAANTSSHISAPQISRPPPPPGGLEPRNKRPWPKRPIPFEKLVSWVLYFAQICLASLSIGLSVWRIVDQKFYDGTVNEGPSTNIIISMNVFYVLALLEAGLFLCEKAYWEYMVRLQKILEKVCKKEHVGIENMELMKQFFYDVYDESLKKSVFDGLNMDLVEYSISWLQTEGYERQLGGARLLKRFVSKNDKFRTEDLFASRVLRMLGTTSGIIERLVEMLSWGSRHEEPLLREVSTIICRLVVYNRNCARFVAVPGAMDGVVSLLLPNDPSTAHPARSTTSVTSILTLRLMGLRILKYLCIDHKNSLKIGETRGLLSILTVFIEVRRGKFSFTTNDDVDLPALKYHLKAYKKTLQVLLLLASATNTSGKTLRNRIANIVSALGNLRDMVQFGSDCPELQRLAIEVFYNLAMEDDVRKMIGATGGVIRNLCIVYQDYRLGDDPQQEGDEHPEEKKISKEKKLAVIMAGETLTRLVLQNERNCKRLLERKDLVPVMVGALSFSDDKVASSAASVLRSVLKYADDETKTAIAQDTAQHVLNKICNRNGSSTANRSEMYEASLGLASRAMQALSSSKYCEILNSINKMDFLQQLMKNLLHTPTTNMYPRIRRFTVELIIVLVEKDDSFLNAFKENNLNLKGVLEKTLDSISEVENFCLFSGLVGYTRHYEEMEDLVERAIAAVDNYQRRTSAEETGEEGSPFIPGA